MASINSIKTDTVAEVDGVWDRYPGTDIEFKIARMDNPEYAAELRQLRRDNAELVAALQQGDEGLNEELENLVAMAVSRRIVRDWRNLEDAPDGGETAPVPYSPDQCYKYLRDPGYRDLYDWIITRARTKSRYMRANMEKTAGK